MLKKKWRYLSLALLGAPTGRAQMETVLPQDVQASPLPPDSSTGQWAMPVTGPAALPEQTIVFIGEDLRDMKQGPKTEAAKEA